MADVLPCIFLTKYLLITSYSLMQAKIVYMQYLVVIRGAL